MEDCRSIPLGLEVVRHLTVDLDHRVLVIGEVERIGEVHEILQVRWVLSFHLMLS